MMTDVIIDVMTYANVIIEIVSLPTLSNYHITHTTR